MLLCFFSQKIHSSLVQNSKTLEVSSEMNEIFRKYKQSSRFPSYSNVSFLSVKVKLHRICYSPNSQESRSHPYPRIFFGVPCGVDATIDNNQDENCHATSSRFHGSSNQTKDMISWIKKVDWCFLNPYFGIFCGAARLPIYSVRAYYCFLQLVY